MSKTQEFVVRYGRDLLAQEQAQGQRPIELDNLFHGIEGIEIRKVYGRGHFAQVSADSNAVDELRAVAGGCGCDVFQPRTQ